MHGTTARMGTIGCWMGSPTLLACLTALEDSKWAVNQLHADSKRDFESDTNNNARHTCAPSGLRSCMAICRRAASAAAASYSLSVGESSHLSVAEVLHDVSNIGDLVLNDSWT
jgi:hypothetical protein